MELIERFYVGTEKAHAGSPVSIDGEAGKLLTELLNALSTLRVIRRVFSREIANGSLGILWSAIDAGRNMETYFSNYC